MTIPGSLQEGYLLDFISGQRVKDTPEEREAVQVFARSLVEDFDYPKTHVRTRPQWRVKVRPSDRKKGYPVDIAVFRDRMQTDENLYIVVECKKPNRTDGRSQLEDYMRLSSAQLGVWFNGNDRLYLAKRERGGYVAFDEIPSIPRYGQRLDDVGKFRRKDLKRAASLKSVFRSIHDFLAANAIGATREEVLAQQVIALVLCKIYDERFTRPDDMVTFRAGIDEPATDVKERVIQLFKRVKTQFNDVLETNDEIELDEISLTYVVGELQNYALIDSERDAVADAFEVFIGLPLKGARGQFFTPRNVVRMVVDMVDPTPNDTIIDPACGSGGFLVESLKHVWKKIDRQSNDYNWPDNETIAEKQRIAMKNFYGIDKDAFLSKLAKAYMAVLGDGRGSIFCENSLLQPSEWSDSAKNAIQMGTFDIVLTNPPFGKKLAIKQQSLLRLYDLGHMWKFDKKSRSFAKSRLAEKQTPQLLFIERCFALLKPDGRLGIVLLESIFGMPKYKYVVDYITRKSKLLAIITLPEDLFQPNTHAKTCVILCQKVLDPPAEPYDIFMCDVKQCGHDSRGNPTYMIDEAGKRVLLDEVPLVAPLFKRGPQL